MGMTMNTIRRRYRAAVARILSDAQRERLSQLELQREGLLAVARKEIATGIGLTTAQSKQVRDVVDEMRRSVEPSMPVPPRPGSGPSGARGNGVDEKAPGGGELIPIPLDGPGPLPPGGPGAGVGPVPGAGPPPNGLPNLGDPRVQAQLDKVRKAMEEARATATRRIAGILTAKQRGAFDKLLGKPFDFSNPQAEGALGNSAHRPASDRPRDRKKLRSRRGSGN
jgi:hypothetical protein